MKNVLITGGTRGIGRAMVELFSASGFGVAFTYKNSDAIALQLSEKTGAYAIKADSAVKSDIERAVCEAKAKLTRVDALINNAAISSFSLFTETSYEVWREMMAVNLDAPFLYSRLVAPHMIANGGGAIINISSMWGLVGSSCEVHYSTAKAGLK